MKSFIITGLLCLFLIDSLFAQVNKFKATAINTNFVVPMARFNFNKDEQIDDAKGSISLFTSVGAGVGLSFGQMEQVMNGSEIVSTDFNNTFGIYAGILFSAQTGEDARNIFAPTVSVNILNFQLGYGYELGKVGDNQKRGFITLAYSIPISKFIKGSYWIWRKGDPIDATTKGNYQP